MSIVTKIHQGTVSGQEDLCASCRFVHRVRTSDGIETRKCVANGGLSGGVALHQRVAECNIYQNKALPDLQSMMDVAWEIVSKGERGGRSVGFISPEDRRKAGIGYSGPTATPGFGF